MDAIVGLDIERLDIKRLAQSLKQAIQGYKELGLDEVGIQQLLATHIPPIGFIDYLQRTYRLGRDMRLILQATSHPDMEVWIKHYRDITDKRGTLDRECHLKLYEPDKNVLLTQEQRRQLLDRLKAYLQILGVLKKQAQVEFDYTSARRINGNYHLTLCESRRDIRKGHVLYMQDQPYQFKVVDVLGNGSTLIVRETSGALWPVSNQGRLVFDPAAVTYQVQAGILAKVINNLESTFLQTTGYPGIDRLLGLAKDEKPTDLDALVLPQLHDLQIKRKKKVDSVTEEEIEEWEGDESEEVAIQLAVGLKKDNSGKTETVGGSRQLIIHGPAGTGKTTTIREIIRQYVKAGKRVLLVTQTNQAVDNAIAEFVEEDTSVPVARLGNDPSVFAYGSEKLWFRKKEAPEAYEEFGRRLKALQSIRKGRRPGSVFAATSIGIFIDREFNKLTAGTKQEFDVIIMDEASKETLTESLVPLFYLAEDGKFIIVGDQKQLPPFSDEKVKGNLIKEGIDPTLVECFYQSVFYEIAGKERADEVTLLTNWRSHPLLAGMVSYLFYRFEGEDEGYVHRKGWEDFNQDTLSLRIIDIADEDEEEQQYHEEPGTKYANNRSALETLALVEHYNKKQAVPLNEITIVTPYNDQVDLLATLMRNKYSTLPADQLPHIATIDSFQGGENHTIIIDTVRSNPQGNIGFLSDLRRFCVLLSRAKENLGIVWDSRVFMREMPLYQISPLDRPARGLLKQLRDYYEREVLVFFPDVSIAAIAAAGGAAADAKGEPCATAGAANMAGEGDIDRNQVHQQLAALRDAVEGLRADIKYITVQMSAATAKPKPEPGETPWDFLERMLERKKLKQKWLVERVGSLYTSLWRYTKGMILPRKAVAQKLADVLEFDFKAYWHLVEETKKQFPALASRKEIFGQPFPDLTMVQEVDFFEIVGKAASVHIDALQKDLQSLSAKAEEMLPRPIEAKPKPLPEEDPTEFLKRMIKKRIEERGVNQKWVAEEVGVSQSYLTRLLTEDILPRQDLASKLAEVIDFDFESYWQLIKVTQKQRRGIQETEGPTASGIVPTIADAKGKSGATAGAAAPPAEPFVLSADDITKIERAKRIAPQKTGLVIANDERIKEWWVNFLKDDMQIGTVKTATSEEEAGQLCKAEGMPDVVINTFLDTSEENRKRLQEALGFQDIEDIILVANIDIDLAEDEQKNRIMLAVAESI
jgi:ribosome-binding protein aMBF1 (putative translation factor)/GTPase SAR1 family protein